MNMKSKPLMAVVLILALAPASSGLGVEGVIFDAEAAPGQHVIHEITVSLREGEDPMDLQVEILDWGQSPDGANQEQETEAESCCSAKEFLRASPENLHLEPGESQKVTVEGDVPADVGSGGRYALVSVHSSIPEGEGSEGMVGVAVAINALVRLTMSGTELVMTGEIADVGFDVSPNSRQQNVSLLFRNTGNYHYKAQAEARLNDRDGNTLSSASSPLSSNIIPCASRIFQVALAPEMELSPGIYRLMVAVKKDDGSILATNETEIAI